MSGDAVGFWSYVQADDRAESNRITRLAELVSDQYGLITGNELRIFVDRHDIRWGEEWKERIDEAIAGTTFLIPVITPRYFKSEACRAELVKFTQAATRPELARLTMPILYIDVPELGEDEPEDEAVRRIARHQWVDWRTSRLDDEGYSLHRKGLAAMATRLAEISDEIASVPDVIQPTPSASSLGGMASPGEEFSSETNDAPGTIELLAESEDAWPKLIAVMNEISGEINRVGEIANHWAPTIAKASEKGSAHVLVAMGQVASDLDDPAESIEAKGNEFASELSRIDPAVRELLRLIENSGRLDEDGQEFIDGIVTLDNSTTSSVESTRELMETLEETARLSREMRRPMATINKGLRNIVDGQVVIREWRDRAEPIRQMA